MMFVVVFGPPCSGKSSLVKRLHEKFGGEVVSSDEFKGRRYGRLFERCARLASEDFVFVNGTFFKRGLREDMREIGGEQLWVFLWCGLDVALERNRLRKDRIGERGLKIMFSEFEMPGLDEYDVKLDSGALSMDEMFKIVDGLIRNRES